MDNQCPHLHTLVYTSGSMYFGWGEVYDTFVDHLICLDCGDEIQETSIPINCLDDGDSIHF